MTEPFAGKIQKRLILLTLVIVVVAGAALRVTRLGAESLWLDEAYSIYTARLPLVDIIPQISLDVHPPLYYYLLHYWINLFGDSEVAARSLSVLFGIGAIVLIYKLAALLFDRVTGLFSAVLLAWSHFNIEYSQEARMYSLLTLLSLGSFWFFLKLLRKDSGLLSILGYVVCTSLLTYTQVYSVFIIAAENLFFLFLLFSSRDVFRRNLWRWVLSQVIVLLLFGPWLVVLKHQISEHKSFWIRPPTLFELRYAFEQTAGSFELFFLLVPLAAIPVLWMILEKLSKAHSPATVIDNDDLPLNNSERVAFLFVWLICPVFLPFLASYFVTPFFLAKYTICASLAFVILAARGLRMVPFRVAGVPLLIVFILLAQSDLRVYWNTYRKDRWRDGVSFFNQKAQANDVVVFTEPGANQVFDYYSAHRDLVQRPFPLFNREFNAETVGTVLKPVVYDHDRVWIVMSHQNDLCALVPKQMSEWYTVVEHHNEPGVEIYLYQKKSTSMARAPLP